jgi:hypothetical protein
MPKQSTIKEIENLFRNEGETFDGGDVEEIKINPPKKSSFPWFIFAAAVFVDIISLLEFTLIGIIVSKIAIFFMMLIVFLWVIMKDSHLWQKKMMGWVFARLGITAVVEAFLGFFPATSIFVFMVSRKEKKITRLWFMAFDKLKKAKQVG